jgi:hypothetical protein
MDSLKRMETLMKLLSLTIPHVLAALSAMTDAVALYASWNRTERRRPRTGLALPLLALLCAFPLILAPDSVVAQDTTPLTAPTELSASVSAEGITISWTAPAGTVDGYEVLRRRPLQSETDLSTLVDNTGDSETSYTDTSATTLGEQYVYAVKTIRGNERSTESDTVSAHFVSVSCAIQAGDNHDILQCTLGAGDLVVSSALWTPSFEAQYAQTTSRPAAAWVIAEEYCGQSTDVVVEAQSGASALPTVETTITLECSPEPADVLTVSCVNLVENDEHVLSCELSGGDQTITSAEWTPYFDASSAKTTEGDEAAKATWVIDDADYCGQNTTLEVAPTAGTTDLPTLSKIVPLSCVITVDDNCSLANAIRSANGGTQVEESGDSDGNDDCEDGGDPNDNFTPPYAGDDIILLKKNVTLTGALPTVTSRIQLEGNGHSISGDAAHRVLMVVGERLSMHDTTITKGLAPTVGGGVYVNSGSLYVRDSTFKANKANDIGGGIYSIDSDVDIADTEFSENMTVKSHGGGAYFISSAGSNTLDISGVTFKKNMATEDGGALKTAGGIVTISKSTFVENQGDEGGAIESSETTLDISNSTFSNNTAREGGGLSSFSSFVTLTHTTWAYNSAQEQGGGIAIIGWTGNFRIRNSLITNSANGGDCDSGPNPDIIIEFTGNIIQDGSCTPAPAESQAAASDGAAIEADAQHADHDEPPVVLADVMISGLSGNPPHHALQWGSPAIDTANPMYCLLDDQPLTLRPQYGNCDVGAYEYPKPPNPPDPDPPADPPDDTPTDPPPAETPEPTPTPIPEVCVPNDRIVVRSSNPDLDCAEIDILTLDKHPALQGIRFALRLWESSNECLHSVAPGDNLYRLAIQYETTVEVLKRHNNLPNNELSIGQLLVLPSCKSDAAILVPGAEVCFGAQGSIALIDTATPERTIHPIAAYASGGMTCGIINKPGVVVLVASASS